MAFIDASSETLTGVWQGLYNDADGQVSFTATLMELGPMLSGTTHETMGGEDLFAMIDGRRSGYDVSFTKTYDGSGGYSHSVKYEGRLSADGTEIEGHWAIGTSHRGTFLMLRSGGKSAAVAKKTYEVV